MSVLDWFRPRKKRAALQITSADDLAAAIPFALMSAMKTEPGELEKRSAPTGETTPRGLEGREIRNELRLEHAIRNGYSASSWTYACMWRRAVSAGSVPWVVEEAEGGDWQPLEGDHDLKDLIEEPNPYWGFQDMVELASLYLDGGGDCLFTKIRDDGTKTRPGRVRELYPISPDNFAPVSGGTTELTAAYAIYRDGAITRHFDPSECIHFKLAHPLNPWRGLSTIQAGCRAVDVDSQALRFQFATFKNQAIPSGAVLMNRPLSDAQMKDAERRLQDKIGPENARKLFVFGNAANWARLSLTPQELDFLASRGFGLTEICALFMTPPPMVGWYEKATLSNIQESRKIYWLDNMILWLNRIRRTLNRMLVRPDFGRDLRLNYDLRQVDALISVRAENEKRARNLWEMGVPFNQCNRELSLGFRPVPGGDVPYIPANVVPEGMLPAGAQSNGNGLPILEE